MKIIVSIKQVPVRDSQLRIDANGRWIQENDLSFEINEPDAYALEEALQLKEKHGGEVVALCAGPARAAQTIREALAKGADRAIHIEEENLNTLDTLGVAKLLAGAVKAENPDLIPRCRNPPKRPLPARVVNDSANVLIVRFPQTVFAGALVQIRIQRRILF